MHAGAKCYMESMEGRRWIGGLLKSGSVLFWTDVCICLTMVAVALTGAILEWVLPHGGGGMRRAGLQRFLGLSRHDWGEVHFYLALTLVAGVTVHVLSHANWVWASLKKRLLQPLGLIRAASGRPS